MVSYRKIPSHQFAQLGGNLVLSGEGNFVIGERIKDIGGAFRLTFQNLDYQTFMNLSAGGAWREQLKTLISDYVGAGLEAHIDLELKKEEVPAWRLGRHALGRDVWSRSRRIGENQTVNTGIS